MTPPLVPHGISVTCNGIITQITVPNEASIPKAFLTKLPYLSEVSLEQAHNELWKATSDENLKYLVSNWSKFRCKHGTEEKHQKDWTSDSTPGSVIVCRSAPPLQYTPTCPSGTWWRMDKLFLKDDGDDEIATYR